MEKLYVIKIGGNVIDDPAAFHNFLKDFSEIKYPKILVHGGGKIATELGKKLQIESHYIDGRRITGDETIDLVTMVYGGLINKRAVALLQSLGCNAIGVTGADGNLMPAMKRPVKDIDYGWVGDIDPLDIPGNLWHQFIRQGLTPVVAPLTHDNGGHLLNTNADTIASVLSIALSEFYETTLVYCFEKKGVLADVNDENSLIKELNIDLYEELKYTDKLFAGILPKLENAFDAKRIGVSEVLIGDSASLRALIQNKEGTEITLNK